ncbi:hypothetical protein N7333_02355 [Pseudomonas sp. GD04158]|uniref:hypothetical protein n=1 Tax=Pseudomonas sp. GD04158 TaxID=2975439 RepID=UPI002449E41E|nr:hypothetical protein [Pseudomonas sp. GD04158]MDH0095420.1 hypothetical protein [Pseudomonas sp. GD04158]
MSFEIVRNDNGTEVAFEGGHRFGLPAISDDDFASYPIQILNNSISLAAENFSKLSTISQDGTLSALGIDQKSEPVKAEMVSRIAAAAGQVRMFEGNIANMEARLYAFPTIDPGNAVAAIEDREVRDWWRSMKASEQAKLLEEVKADPGKHERLMIALMRAPAPLSLLDWQTKFVAETWKEAKRAADPVTAYTIENDRRLVETSRSGLTHVAAIAGRVSGWKAETILRNLIKSPFEPVAHGFDIFGFDSKQVALMRDRMAKEQRR